jgi:polyhydroxybutyrate depolymerase
MHGGIERSYMLHVPPGASAHEPMPLVVMCHGAGGSAELSETATGWSRKGAECRFLVAYPNATRPDATRPATFLRNPQIWRTGSGASPTAAQVDDVAFVDALLDEIAAGYPVDLRRVYLCGFSNGASFALVAAARLSTRFAAVAAVAGKLWNSEIAMERPLPLLYMTGDADPLNPIAGGAVESPWGGTIEHPPLSILIETWTRLIGFRSKPAYRDAPEGVTIAHYGRAQGEAEMVMYTVGGCGHVWPGGENVLAERITGPGSDAIDATGAIWAFFARHALG